MGNKKGLVIFGTSQISELAHYYFSNDSDYQVIAFTVEDEFAKSSNFLGLPIIKWSQIQLTYPPAEYDLFIAVSYNQINELRKDYSMKL